MSESLWGAQRAHTNSGEVQQAGEDNHPGVRDIHNVATVELEEHLILDAEAPQLNENVPKGHRLASCSRGT